jgi:predicted alpha/beta hydrolase family esterase
MSSAMKTKHQILIIHGGETFRTKKDYLHYLKTKKVSLEKRINWAGDYFENELGDSFQVIRPRMPLQDNARYKDWKIIFERYIPLLQDNVILIGNSLGGIFLAKYLSENKFPKKILSTYLSCAPFDDSMPDEDLAGGFKLKKNLSLLNTCSKNLYLLFSKDDNVVPVSHGQKYAKHLANAKLHIFDDKNGHFNVPTFPEIIRMIKGDVK